MLMPSTTLQKWPEEKPARCPFCGGKAFCDSLGGEAGHLFRYRVYCTDCLCGTNGDDTRAEAAFEKWQRRYYNLEITDRSYDNYRMVKMHTIGGNDHD